MSSQSQGERDIGLSGRWATLDSELIQRSAYSALLKGRRVSVGASCWAVWLLLCSFLCPCFPGHRKGGEPGGEKPPSSHAMQVSDLLGMVANLDLCARPSQSSLGGCLALSPMPLLPHLPVVPLIVSLWLLIRHCRPGSGFLEGKSPSLGTRITVVGELTLMGLTPRKRGLDFSVFCGVWFLLLLF